MILLAMIVTVTITVGFLLYKNQQSNNTPKEMPLAQDVKLLETTEPTEPKLIGGNKDPHGCLVGAGYSWCDKTNSCIRVWEQYCTSAESKKVTYNCKDNKRISATFYPTDDKYVDLKLGEDMNISLPKALSASGARYAKEDESFVFWDKGGTAFVTENGTETYSECGIKK